MPPPELGRWQPLTVQEIVEIFSPAPFRWWISGGWALELHFGRTWRAHEDIDVGVVRAELDAVYAHLSGWDLHVAAAGRLRPWHGQPLSSDAQQNNVWCRAKPDGPWLLDMTIGEGSDRGWVYRRDPSFQLPWRVAMSKTSDGVPYLAPDLQLLFKSKTPRPKDDVDAAEVIPELDEQERARLIEHLDPDHPWRRFFDEGP